MTEFEHKIILLRQENILLRCQLERVKAIVGGDMWLCPFSDVDVPMLNETADDFIHPANQALRDARTWVDKQR